MRSDWHRYNLKRRVTSLPPIPSELFTEKVLAAQASNNAEALKSTYERSCEVCAKTYFSENAYQNHIGSQKHRVKALAQEGGSGVSDETSSVMSSTFSLGQPVVAKKEMDLDSDDEMETVVTAVKKTTLKESEPQRSTSEVSSLSSAAPAKVSTDSAATLNRCLFCNYDSPTVKLNVVHMERIHSMFIPEMSYLVDLEGLVGYLHEKIYEDHECLYCGKLKPTVFGLQTHMRDKGHCKIPFGTEDEQLEIGEFYDFRSTYSDDEPEESEDDEPSNSQGGVKLGLKRPTKITNEEGDVEIEEGDGWETDSSASSLDSEELTAVPLDEHTHQYEKLHMHPHHSHEDPRPHRNVDGWHSHAHKHAHAAFYSDYELHLPSGRSVGHRSLAKYYRQNLVNHPSPSERQEQLAIAAAASSDDDEEQDQQLARRTERERGRALATRANGGRGMIGVSESKKREVKVAEKRARKMEERERRRFQWGNNKQSNSQKHFRDPLLQ